MGKLIPGATYIYERVDNEIYARLEGSTERKMIGRTYNTNDLHSQIQDSQLWYNIRKEAETNPALQNALDRVIMLYKLTKETS